MSYVYIQSERSPALFTVGHFDPKGIWHSDSDHSGRAEAGARVAYLNGGKDINDGDFKALLDALYEIRDAILTAAGKS